MPIIENILNRKYQMVEAAKAIKTRPRMFFLALSFIGMIALFYMIFFPAALLFVPIDLLVEVIYEISPLWAQTVDFGFELALSFCLIIFSIYVWTRYIDKKPIIRKGFYADKKLNRIAVGCLAGFGSLTLVVVLLLLSGHAIMDNDAPKVSGIAALPYVLFLLVPWILQGASEEILIQGWFMPKAAKSIGLGFGVLIASFVFMFLHLGNEGLNEIALVNMFLHGVFAAGYTLYEEGLVGICMYHAIWNWSQGHIYGMRVSGVPVEDASIFSIADTGNTLFSGGAFGPQGGLVTTFVLLISIAIMIQLLYQKSLKPQIHNERFDYDRF